MARRVGGVERVRKEGRRGGGVVFGWGGFGTDKRLDRGRGGGAGGGDGGVGCGKVRVAEGGHAATAAPGADPAGDELSTGGETGGGSDAMFGAGRQVPAGGGRDGRGQTSSGPAARCETGLRGDGGEHHKRPEGNVRWRVLRGSEARFDRGATGAAATRGAADRGRIAGRRRTGEGDGGDAGQDIALRQRADGGVAGRDARRPGVCGSAGMLERAECVSEPSGGSGTVVDERAGGGGGADIARMGRGVCIAAAVTGQTGRGSRFRARAPATPVSLRFLERSCGAGWQGGRQK